MGCASDAKLVIKHTFLEFVGGDKPPSEDRPARRRSQTEPAIFEIMSYGEVRDWFHGSDAASSSSSCDVETWPTEALCSGPTVLASATPEATPWHGPAAGGPWSVEEQWSEGVMLPEAIYGWQGKDDAFMWNAQYEDWWAQCLYMNLPSACCELPAVAACEAQPEQQVPPTFVTATAATKETRTTVMLRELPKDFTRSSLLKLLNAESFFGRFDFVYLPVDFKHQRNLGYALINLVSSAEALRFIAHFEGFSNWGVPNTNLGSVMWCSPQQGLEAHVERYRNSPVMHETVPEEWRPLLLSHGVPITFPPPTINIKAPKVKARP